ncbi:hypothetical protein H8R18_00360 [Nanchangia anserum]|uniref:Uncharacterized protein n=1 Tax=Nanchangia anserum TaxID=2692125 RepID=A0A8I0G884_9ACTO|nr:hypothetical protein [Nanchangia anserum]MBD3689700.1 hypothetical protein [Nanchangia anserum]QOX81875.1 hypothetical protein H8R18_00360 [Nanchangia anserum]
MHFLSRPRVISFGIIPAVLVVVFFGSSAVITSGEVITQLVQIVVPVYCALGAVAVIVSAIAAVRQPIHVVAKAFHVGAAGLFVLSIIAWIVMPTMYMGSGAPTVLAFSPSDIDERLLSMSILGAIASVLAAFLVLITTVLTRVLASRR